MAGNRRKDRAVFIDRDGTVIRERNYLRKIKDIRLLSGAVPGLMLLKKAGFRLVMVTNQSGVGRGYLSEEKLKKIHDRLQAMLLSRGCAFDAVHYCVHLPTDGCGCRKPNTGMVRDAARRFNLDLKRSYSIGDHVNDFKLGQNMGGKGVFVLTGHGRRELKRIKASKGKLAPDAVAKDFMSGARWIIRDSAGE